MPHSRRRSLLRYAALFALLTLAGCRTGRDYPAADEPRYAGVPSDTTVRACTRPCDLRIVSFNIEFARRIDLAISLLSSDTALRGADIILLQEMDAPGTKRIAERLGMWYVYHPAIFHRGTRRDFGNAVLSRWPIVDDAKLVLPHPSRYARTHRTATAATLRIDGSYVRVYSTHLGTVADIGSGRRRDQFRAILSDAASHPIAVIGGDLNDERIGVIAQRSGYDWPTRNVPPSSRFGRLDHVFLRGLRSAMIPTAGTVTDSRGVGDHHPVWALGVLH